MKNFFLVIFVVFLLPFSANASNKPNPKDDQFVQSIFSSALEPIDAEEKTRNLIQSVKELEKTMD